MARSISSAFANVDRAHVYSERGRYGLDSGKLADPTVIAGSRMTASSRHARRNLLEQFQPFRAQVKFED